MRLIKTLTASVLSSLSLACVAGSTLTFEGVGDLQTVGSFYADKGISFGGDAYGIVSVVSNGSGRFKNTPSGSTALTLISNDEDVSFIVNISAGFQSELDLWFSTQRGGAGEIRLYDQINGLGNELTAAPLALDPVSQTGCVDPVFGAMICQWRETGISFQGTAYSLRISGSAEGLLFIDNLRLGAADSNNVPEPASLALALAGVGAAALTRRRKAAVTAA